MFSQQVKGIKKGIVELADVILVNKSDGVLEGPARIAQMEYISALKFVKNMSPNWTPEVLRISSAEKNGLDEAWDTMNRYYNIISESHELEDRRGLQRQKWVWSIVTDELVQELRENQQVQTALPKIEKEVRISRTGVLPAEFLTLESSPEGFEVCILDWNACFCKTDGDASGKLTMLEVSHYFVIPDDHFLKTIRTYTFDCDDCDLIGEYTSTQRGRFLPEPQVPVFELKETENGNASLAETLISARSVSLRGTIAQKSGLIEKYGKSKGRAFFIISLKLSSVVSTPFSITVHIVLEKDMTDSTLLMLYHRAKLGFSFIFTDLKPTRLEQDSAPSTIFLKFGPFSRLIDCTIEDRSLFNDILFQYSDLINQSFIKFRNHTLISYSGTISKIRDPTAGHYEIDGKFHLFLTHASSIYRTPTLRRGAVVKITNCHIICRKPQMITLVACPMTTLEIEKFSPFVDDGILFDSLLQKEALLKLKGLRIPDIILLTSIRKILNDLTSLDPNEETKISLETAKGILAELGFRPMETAVFKVANLLNHDVSCEVALPSTEVLKVYSLEEVLATLDSQLAFSEAKGHALLSQASQETSLRIFSSQELGFRDALLLGRLLGDDCGKLVLSGKSKTIPVLGQSMPKLFSEAKTLLGITKFELVLETFLCQPGREPLVKKHIRIPDDGVLVSETIILPKANEELSSLKHQEKHLIRLQNIMPARMMLNGVNIAPAKCAHAYAFLWNVDAMFEESGSFRVIAGFGPRRCIIEIGEGALPLVPILASGNSFLITDLEFSEVQPGHGTNLDSFCIFNGQTRVHYIHSHDVVFSSDKALGPNLEKDFESNDEDVSSKIYSVSELITQASALAHSEQIIDLEGKIAQKDFKCSESYIALPHTFEHFLESRDIGCGQPSRTLVLKISDGKSAQTIEVHIENRFNVFEYGLIPGTFLRLRRLHIKKNAREYSCRALPSTSFEMVPEKSEYVDINTLQGEGSLLRKTKSLLKDSMTHDFDHTFVVSVFVSQVLELEISLCCQKCMQIMHNGGFCHTCKAPATKGDTSLRAWAKLFADDGTAESQINLDNAATVFTLLNADSKIKAVIENHLHRSEGPLFLRYASSTGKSFESEPESAKNPTENAIWLEGSCYLANIEHWPTCDFLISFFSNGFPLEKAIRYVKLRRPFCINDLRMQQVLMDRRLVLKILDAVNVPTPKRLISSHSSNIAPDIDKDVVDDIFKRTGADVSREKFMKEAKDVTLADADTIVSKPEGNDTLRKPFVEKPVSGEDHNIRIYYPKGQGGGMRRLFRKVGNKSSEFCPTVSEIRDDGSFIYEEFMFVDNAEDVKVYTIGEGFAHAETRKSPVVDGIVRRNSEGKEIRYITALSDEEKEISKRVCRAFGQTVCGFDLLRANGKSYVIDVNGWSFVKGNDEYYDKCAQILRNFFLDAAKKSGKEQPSKSIESQWRLKAFLSVLRHGDRTPKQKAKLLQANDEEVVLKSDQIQAVSIACNDAIKLAVDDSVPLQSLRAILDLKAELPGTKIQVKPSYSKVDRTLEKVQLIVKWGGEFTHGGKHQSKDLGENLRKDLRIINKALLDDVKVYSSSERRVIATADIFVKAFLDIQEIPSSLVTVSKEMLDDSNAAKEQMETVKTKLQAILNPNEPIKLPEHYLPEDIDDPESFLQEIIDLLSKIRGVMQQNLEEGDEILSVQERWCCAESPYLFKERWEKIFREFCDVDRSAFEPSKISELYDSLKYDLLHNREFCEAIFASPEFGRDLLKQLYGKAKTLFDFIAPQEYGIESSEKLEIGMLNSMTLLKQIVEDLKSARDSGSPCSRLYFTKESKVISLLNIVLLCGLPTKIKNHEIDELDYLTQITFELHERNSAEGQEYSLRIGFSPGAHDPNLIDQTLDGRHSLSVAPRRWISEHISLEEALNYLTPK
ncbi:hypothetical protein HDU97_010320 [Phlyctochytrium planicorne]|nr:hypothetical protein HDU97_010320 [Phlyctochytrium planicorne]